MTSSALSVLLGFVALVAVVYMIRGSTQIKRLQVRLPFGVHFLLETQIKTTPTTRPKTTHKKSTRKRAPEK